ncbi:MAG: EAL domain-containing protein [Gammaproteobacteria bacterium]|nr:EAL domain-containing protein [Gammaproteobacteria bacterium]
MTNQHLNTLELITLQNQLLLSIGASLNARECAYKFIQSTIKSLGLKSIHLYIYEEPAKDERQLVNYLSLPDNNIKDQHQPVIEKIQSQMESDKNSTHITEILEQNEILAYRYGNAGILFFENHQGKFQESLKEALLPVIKKSAEYFQLCEKQKRMNTEAQVSRDAQRTYELQAKRDPLTNLPNRREFRYSLSREISNAQHYEYHGALMYIDLDNFKNVNDSLGHSIGDILLTQVAQRLNEQTRSGDTVFRIGGDEFVYILGNIGETEAEAIHTSQTVANRVIETLARPIEIGEFSLHITPSIGIAIFPDVFEEATDSENVLRHADTAMYRAKKQGRNCYAFFNPEMHVEASQRLIIEDHLRKAINNDELHMVYQPIVNTNEDIIGAETLIRWNSPVLGNIPPDQFIGIAEESNLILILSEWIMKRTGEFAEELYKQLDKDSTFSYISINISPRQFIQNDFVDTIISFVNSCDVPNNFIKLEFTENVLLDNIEQTIEKMEKLHENDIDFLLDDFGTGYSSLSYLHKLPISILKIDKSFITAFHSEKNDTRAIVNAILVMTEQLAIKCIVEGVELKEHVDFFKEKAVHGMQGFYYHKPMPDTELDELLCGTRQQVS